MRIFREEQRFTQTWLIVLLVVSVMAPVAIIIKEYTAENSTMTLKELLTTLLIVGLSMSLIFFFKLKTRIDEDGIHYQFFPFHFSLKKITWSEIEKATTRKYDAISEFGGWGLKGGLFWKKSNGIAYNVKGDIGLQLQLVNGKKILIGTQKRAEVDRVLKNYEHKITANEN
ncbi:MAG: hypothetical protein P8K77_05940 [Polaribacter sp.]|nr:hypothetical protein [Polaribacter sp.]